MSVADDKRESGTSLMFMGITLWVADLLVIFFLPAGIRLGSQRTFVGIIAVVGLFGLILLLGGYARRYYGGPEE